MSTSVTPAVRRLELALILHVGVSRTKEIYEFGNREPADSAYQK
jgi:hypothetical protein